MILLYYKDKDNTTGCSTTNCVSDDVFYPLCYYWYLTNNEFIFSDSNMILVLF